MRSSYNHYFRNDFPGGKVIVDGTTYNVPLTPQTYENVEGVWKSYNTGTHSTTAFNTQTTNGQHNFDSWEKNGSFVTNNLSYSFSQIYDPSSGHWYTEHEAQYISTFNVTVRNSTGIGDVIVNGNTYSSPKTVSVTEPGIVIASAVYHIENGIENVFDHWSDGSYVGYNCPGSA